MRARALRFKHARYPTLNNTSRNIDRGKLKPPCCCCRRAGIELSVDRLREVALGHVNLSLVRASFPGHASRGREQSKQPNARVRAILQLPIRAFMLSTVVRLRVSTRAVFFVDCEVRGMSSVLVDQVVGAVCVLAELAGRRGSKKPGFFLGVHSIGESREVMNLTSLKLLQFVFP